MQAALGWLLACFCLHFTREHLPPTMGSIWSAGGRGLAVIVVIIKDNCKILDGLQVGREWPAGLHLGARWYLIAGLAACGARY